MYSIFNKKILSIVLINFVMGMIDDNDQQANKKVICTSNVATDFMKMLMCPSLQASDWMKLSN